MPACGSCGTMQSRLNKGDLCKTCNNDKKGCNNDIITANSINIPPTLKTPDNDDIDNDEFDDRNIIEVIKQSMINEKHHEKELLDLYKEQVNYLKAELKYKNDLIDKLTTQLCHKQNNKNVQSSLEPSMCSRDSDESIVSDVNDISSEREISYHREIEIPEYTDYLKWHPVNNNKNRKSYNHTKKNIDHDNIVSPNKYRSLVIDDASDFNTEFENNYVFVAVIDKVHPTQHKVEVNKRPQVVTNKNPERNINRKHTKKTVPGNSLYSNITSYGKKVLILSDSICGRINIKKLNESLKYAQAVKKIYPGATPKDLEHYCLKPLNYIKPDIVVLNIGTNKIGIDDPFEISSDIYRIVKTCKVHGVKKVSVSSITCRPGHPRLVEDLNNILRARQILHDYELIYNDNITADFIWKDRLHLSNRGNDRLTSNFRRILNGMHT